MPDQCAGVVPDAAHAGWSVDSDYLPVGLVSAMYARLVPAMEQLDARPSGRAHLITFCFRYYIERHLPKPLAVTPAPVG